MIVDLVSFNKKRDREVSEIKRRDMILQRSLACERAKAAANELVKLPKLEEKFAEVYTLHSTRGLGLLIFLVMTSGFTTSITGCTLMP